jgi:tetratricopeptide (TPR) repeat protein
MRTRTFQKTGLQTVARFRYTPLLQSSCCVDDQAGTAGAETKSSVPIRRRLGVLFSTKRLAAIIALGSIASLGLPAQEKKEWKDRAEYDLYDSILKQQNANTKLGLLEQWKQKYPVSDYKDFRGKFFIDTFRQLNNAKGMMGAAKEYAADFPKDILGYVWINLLTISMADTSPDALDTGEKAGNGLLGLVDDFFSPAKKPANVDEAAWKKEAGKTRAMGYRTLGWVAMQRSQFDKAEAQFTEVLKLTPADAQASSWMGTAILRQKKFEKQAAGLYHVARAGAYDGPEALAEAQRKTWLDYLTKTYVNYHGDRGGLDEILAKAKNEAFPPNGFKIESKDEVMQKQEEELKKTNPNLALWVGIKRELTGANAASYFENTLKGAKIPGGADVGGTKIEKVKAKVVATKAGKAKGSLKEIVVGVSSAEMSEVTLRFETAIAASVDPGAEVEFSGVPAEYSADPFNLVMDVEPDDVTGLTKTAPAAAKKGGGGAAKKGGPPAKGPAKKK